MSWPKGPKGYDGWWRPTVSASVWGERMSFIAPCMCDTRLGHRHTEQSCPYIDPDDWYALEVARMAERAPA